MSKKPPEPGTPLWQLLSNAKSLRLAGDTNAADAIRSAERRDENYREAAEYERAAYLLSDVLDTEQS